MKLCHVVPSLQAQHGGPSKSVAAICAALARQGHRVELFSTDPSASRNGESHVEGNLCTRMFHRDWPDRICRSSGLRRALLTTDADIIHHHSLWLRTLHYAHRGAVRRGAKLVISPRGMMSNWAWAHRNWRKRLARTLVHPGALTDAAGWHATSTDEAIDIRAQGFTAPLCVAPNGVDAPAPEERAAAIAHWREACPEVATRPVAVFYSRFHRKKRVLELIDAWIERAPAHWLLLLVGIPQDYTPEVLEAYVLKMSAAGRVRAFSGAGRPPPFAVASLFVLPSHNENFGLAIAEAMAHGVPALVTNTTPWMALNEADRGWCVPWDDYPAALAAATAEPVERLRQRGAIARDWVLHEFSWDRAARQLGEFYATLVPSAAAR